MHGVISEESPFGKALLGAKEGDTVTVEAPRGCHHLHGRGKSNGKGRVNMAEQKTNQKPQEEQDLERAAAGFAGRSWQPCRTAGERPLPADPV